MNKTDSTEATAVKQLSPAQLTEQAAHKLKADNREYNIFLLPWRNPRTVYRIFLAEFLLVRTRADVVAKIFEQIVTQFPNVQTLAEADETHLAIALEPLGLRKRVPLLTKAAQYLLEHYNGECILSGVNGRGSQYANSQK